MALIQWKQISGDLSGSAVLTGSLEISGSLILNNTAVTASGGGGSTDTGSLLTTGSVSGNVLTFTKGNGDTFNLTVDTGSGGGATDTGSLITTASVATNTITFTKGDGSTFTIENSYIASQSIENGLLRSYGFGSAWNSSVNLNSLTSSADSASYVSAGNIDGIVSSSTIATYTSEWTLGANGSSDYTFSGPGFTGSANDPTIYLVRGQQYKFTNTMGAHPFRIQTTVNGSTGTQYSNGITNNDVSNGTLLFNVPMDAPETLYYQCTSHGSMGGPIRILDETPISSSHAINADTASTAVSSSFAVTASHLTGTITSASYADTSSFTVYDGNRVISQAHLPGFYTSSFNAGTSGSVVDFLDAIFFPNRNPSIDTDNNITVVEFLDSGSTIATISGSDPDGHSLTFTTQSSYTADKVRLATNGVLTLNTSSVAELFNPSHSVAITATDTYGKTATQTLYINVTPNSAPVFRETSNVGNIITSFTSSRNENASAGEIAKIYFTDANSDTITIVSNSLDTDIFSANITGSYISLRQVTASLDYENTISHSFSFTASDEHFQAGQDTDASSSLLVNISVNDNANPTINNQTLAGVNENSSNGASAGTVTATDPEGDTITFSSFTLTKLELDNVDVSTGTYGGTSQATDPHEDPFQINAGTGEVTRKVGVFLNSDLINEYQYSVIVTDAFNTASNSATITIPIADDTPATLTDNWSAGPYVLESALSSSNIFVSSSGYNGSQADFNSNQSGTYTSSNAAFNIDISGNITLTLDISGSATGSGDSIASTITFTNTFGTTTTDNLTVSVVGNSGPTGSYSDTSGNLNTNLATSGSTISTLTWNDAEGDNIEHGTISFTDPSSQLNAFRSASSNVYLIQPLNTLSGSTTYGFTASIKDEHGFDSGSYNNSVTIAQANVGTLAGDTDSFIIESAISGAVFRDASGFGSGSASQLTVSYSPNYGSQAVSSFTSSNSAVVVDNSGNVTVNVNISGSSTGSGDTILSDITFADQYGNIGSGSFTGSVFANDAPEASFSDQTSNLTASISTDTNLVSVTITDSESDTPFSMSLAGDVTNLKAVPQNANSSSYQIQASSTISTAGTLNYTASIFDNFDETRNYNRSLTIAEEQGLVYLYGFSTPGTPASEAAAIGTLGDTGADGVDVVSGSAIAHLESGSIGQSLVDVSGGAGGTLTLYASASLTDLVDNPATGSQKGLSNLGSINFSATSSMLLVLFPSASFLSGKPASMYDGAPPDSTGTADEYYVYSIDAAIPGTTAAGIYYFDLENTYQGSSDWGMIFAEGKNTNNTRYYLMPDSSSTPSF